MHADIVQIVAGASAAATESSMSGSKDELRRLTDIEKSRNGKCVLSWPTPDGTKLQLTCGKEGEAFTEANVSSDEEMYSPRKHGQALR